jgi:Ca2+-binding RTX toxin-like protein
MPNNQDWANTDQSPDNPYGKSTDYESFLGYLGALPRPLTPTQAHQPITINVSELNNHPDYKAAAIGALQQWAAVTPLQFTIVDNRPYDPAQDYMQVVSPELGQQDEGTAFSSGRYVSIGQKFHDTEPSRTELGGYVFDSFMHEFGHEFGLNHPGLYNYSGPGGVQINYLNNATWVYDRQQYSIMTYFDGIDVGETSRWTATTPMVGDIEAVIRHYFSTVDATTGVRTYDDIQLNTGDDTYGFGSTKFGYGLTASGPTHDIGFVIHDTGGNDTLDFSGSTAGTEMDLRAGRFSSVNGHHYNVAIFAGHNADQSQYYIENGIGSRYADVLIGNDGNNVLDGRGGADRMAGNGGDDTYFVDNINDVVREEANGGNDTVVLLSRNLHIQHIANVEHIIYADGSTLHPGGGGGGTSPTVGDHSLTSIIYGDGGDNTLDGAGGDDTIIGRGGDDLLIGGRDSLASRDINNTIPFANLADKTESDDGNDTLYGGAGDDTILGGQGNDILDGGDGNDTLSGQAGIDIFRGGAGVDTVDYSKESPFQLLVNLATNIASGGTGSGDTFYSIENLIGSDDRIDRFIGTAAANHFWGQGGGDYFNGGGGNDILDGGRDGDIIYGEGGNDTVIGGSGQDYLNGGAGIDTVVYSGSAAGVTIDLAHGTANGGDGDGPVQIVGRGTTIRHDILAGFENAVGSAFDDHLIGTAGHNILSGGGGDDTLTGGRGADTLRGGAGSDTADYSDATRGLNLALGGGVGKHAGDTYISIENLAGSAFADHLTGNGAANVLTGQGGADTIDGRGGDDTLLGDFAYQGDVPPSPGMGTGYATLGHDATNNSIATAFDISNNFSLTADPNIFDSTTVPHTTVTATGNGHGGYYSINLAAGTVLSIDIDGIADPDVHDSWVQLLDSTGNVVTENDDGGGDPGSNNTRDSSTVFVVQETGTYYILEGQWSPVTGVFDPSVPDGSTYTLNVSVDSPPPPAQPGVARADTLLGGTGNDLLDGGLGADILAGGAGEDSFRFSTALGNGNVDRITDFNVARDTILLDNLIFTEAGSDGPLALGAFFKSAAGVAHDSDDRVIYDTDSGRLYYDADGTGQDTAIQFARLNAHLNLTAADFTII